MTRSQLADIECARDVLSYIPEAKTAVAELWAERFISKQRRDFLNAFLMSVEEAGARLTLRSSGNSETGLSAAPAQRPSSKSEQATEEETAA